MAKYVNNYKCAGKNYATEEAQNRMYRIIREHHDTELARRLAGRGPFTATFDWAVKGNNTLGWYVEETIVK